MFWTDNGCTPDDVEYVVSVTNSAHSDPEKHVTNQKNITLNVTEGVNYTITVTAQICDGNITSESSKPLQCSIIGMHLCAIYLAFLTDNVSIAGTTNATNATPTNTG